MKKLYCVLICLTLSLSGCASWDKQPTKIVTKFVECERPKAIGTTFGHIWNWAQELDAAIVKCNSSNKEEAAEK